MLSSLFLCLPSNREKMTTLQSGDAAPHFNSIDQDGKKVSLEDYLKQNWLVIYFYPHDMTPTCTVQACNLRDGWNDLEKAGVTVLGVSEDSEKKHQKFIDKHNLPFPLLADTTHEVMKAYQVWGPKKFMGRISDATHRTTFIIDKTGIIRHVIHPVKSKKHTEEIVEVINELDKT